MRYDFRLPSPDVPHGIPDCHHRPGVDVQAQTERWWNEVARRLRESQRNTPPPGWGRH